MAVLDHIRPYVRPLLHNLIVHGLRGAHGARQRQWTEQELAGLGDEAVTELFGGASRGAFLAQVFLQPGGAGLMRPSRTR